MIGITVLLLGLLNLDNPPLARQNLWEMFWAKWLTWAKWALKRSISTINFDSLFFNLCGTDIDLLYKHLFDCAIGGIWSWSSVANVWISTVSCAWLHVKHIGASGLDVNTRGLNKFDLAHLLFYSYRWFCPWHSRDKLLQTWKLGFWALQCRRPEGLGDRFVGCHRCQ